MFTKNRLQDQFTNLTSGIVMLVAHFAYSEEKPQNKNLS